VGLGLHICSRWSWNKELFHREDYSKYLTAFLCIYSCLIMTLKRSKHGVCYKSKYYFHNKRQLCSVKLSYLVCETQRGSVLSRYSSVTVVGGKNHRVLCESHGQNAQFLGACAKVRKVTICFVMSVCPSVRPYGTNRLSLDEYSRNLVWGFSKICRENSSFIKIW